MSLFDIVYVFVVFVLTMGLGVLLMVMWVISRDRPSKRARVAPARSPSRTAAAVRPSPL